MSAMREEGEGGDGCMGDSISLSPGCRCALVSFDCRETRAERLVAYSVSGAGISSGFSPVNLSVPTG